MRFEAASEETHIVYILCKEQCEYKVNRTEMLGKFSEIIN